MQHDQSNSQHGINYQTVKKLRQKLNKIIFPGSKDLFKKHIGQEKPFKSKGRNVIKLTNVLNTHSQYLVSNKDQNVLYFIKQITLLLEKKQQTLTEQEQFERIIRFKGYKLELNRYIIYGEFDSFVLVSLIQSLKLRTCENKNYGKMLLQNLTFEYEENKNCLQNNILVYVSRFSCIDTVVHQFSTAPELYLLNGNKKEEKKQKYNFGVYLSEKMLLKVKNNEILHDSAITYFIRRVIQAHQCFFWTDIKQKSIKMFPIQFFGCLFKIKENNTKYISKETFQEYLIPCNKNSIKMFVQAYSLVLFPITIKNRSTAGQNHFILGAFIINSTVRTLKILLMDPFGDNPHQLQLQILRLVSHQLNSYLNNPFTISQMTSVVQIGWPLQPQHNTTDCGLYVSLYTLLLVSELFPSFIPNDIRSILLQHQNKMQVVLCIRSFIYESYISKNHIFMDLLFKIRNGLTH